MCLCHGWQYIFLCKKISLSWKKNIKGTKDLEAISWRKGLQDHKQKVVKISLPGTDAQIGGAPEVRAELPSSVFGGVSIRSPSSA